MLSVLHYSYSQGINEARLVFSEDEQSEYKTLREEYL